MLRPRVIPTLLLRGRGLVKTVRFKDPKYLGDPRNTVKIFNEMEVDELVLLDIQASPEERQPNFDLVREIVSEAFMPLGYGGGLRTVEDCQRVVRLGVEKVVLNTITVEDSSVVQEAAAIFGSQSVVASIDVRKKLFGGYEVMIRGGSHKTGIDAVEHAVRMAELGAGEILLTSIDRDGTMRGYDLDLVTAVTDSIDVPVVACGGAASVADLAAVIRQGGASAAAAGSMFVFHGKHRAVLISFPFREELEEALA